MATEGDTRRFSSCSSLSQRSKKEEEQDGPDVKDPRRRRQPLIEATVPFPLAFQAHSFLLQALDAVIFVLRTSPQETASERMEELTVEDDSSLSLALRTSFRAHILSDADGPTCRSLPSHSYNLAQTERAVYSRGSRRFRRSS